MIDATHKLPLTRQAELLDVSRSNVYYLPRPVSAADLAIMRRIDELHLNFPFAGARMLRDMLKLEGIEGTYLRPTPPQTIACGAFYEVTISAKPQYFEFPPHQWKQCAVPQTI
jgi:putative transposase